MKPQNFFIITRKGALGLGEFVFHEWHKREKEDVKLHGTEDTLTISVETPNRKYFKDIEMPSKIDPKKAKTIYKNGVLEVTIPTIKEKKKPSGEQIKIE